MVFKFNKFINPGKRKLEEKLIYLNISDGIDFSKYCLDPIQNKSKYDLFAVTNFFGEDENGHYTSYCKEGKQWFSFNDAKVLKIHECDVITVNNYMLYFKRQL
jgi:ubiquitin carboxyl-terminal hydrolase 22/27/51